MEDKPKYRGSFIGNQAASIDSSSDRILALKHLTTSMHTLLSRTIILKTLSILSITSNFVTLIDCLKFIGLTDITEVVRLMILVAMNRVEISSISDYKDISHNYIPSHFSQLISNLSFTSYSCLHQLGVIIAALAHSEVEASRLVIDICSKDLMKCAIGAPIPKYSFAVTQSLVNILSIHGGYTLFDISKEDANNFLSENEQTLKLINSLAAFILSNKVDRMNYKQWAAQQLYKCFASDFQMTTGK